MYAVIQTGGKQYRVSPGDLVHVEKLSGEVGEQITFEEVLFLGEESNSRIGEPLVEGASVTGTIVDQTRADKVLVLKFKRRKMYRRKMGHRQSVTAVRIEEIKAAPGAASSKKADSSQKKEAEPAAKATESAQKTKTRAKKSSPAEKKVASPPEKETPAVKKTPAKAKAKSSRTEPEPDTSGKEAVESSGSQEAGSEE